MKISTLLIVFLTPVYAFSQSSWTYGTTSIYPTGTTHRLGIGASTQTDVSSKLTLIGGDFEIKGNQSIKCANGFGLTIRNGNSTGALSPNLSIIGSENFFPNTANFPGDVVIQSGNYAISSTMRYPSTAPLVVGYNAVGIGTYDIALLRNNGYKLGIAGKMIAEEVVVKLTGSWPDFVFSPTYVLDSLEAVENYIHSRHSLPGMPSENELKEKGGIAVSEMLTAQMKKIEELTLYILQQHKAIAELQSKVTKLENSNR